MSAYTKGQWLPFFNDNFWEVNAPSEYGEASRYSPSVAFVWQVGEPETQEANARLIAAAPELLEALKACHLQMLQSNNDSEYAQQANEMALAAIAKAEGL